MKTKPRKKPLSGGRLKGKFALRVVPLTKAQLQQKYEDLILDVTNYKTAISKLGRMGLTALQEGELADVRQILEGVIKTGEA